MEEGSEEMVREHKKILGLRNMERRKVAYYFNLCFWKRKEDMTLRNGKQQQTITSTK